MVLSGKKRPLLLIPVIIILFTLWVHYTRITSSVRIGVSLNLSETADPAELHMEQGIELAADILNEKGGINGRRLEIMTLDNKGNEKGGEIAAENAALRHASALIGPLDSKLLSPTAIVGENRDLPIITPAYVDTDMWTDTCTGIPYNYVFTASLTSAEEGRAMAAFASQKLHKSRILVIYAGDSPRST
ncbi:MAG: ABC transporter substrate-binding protein, partial [Megasphaera micronuciformis]|nr:ABC transporter substrate-binding protein [Megasphaera micronuciformis]